MLQLSSLSLRHHGNRCYNNRGLRGHDPDREVTWPRGEGTRERYLVLTRRSGLCFWLHPPCSDWSAEPPSSCLCKRRRRRRTSLQSAESGWDCWSLTGPAPPDLHRQTGSSWSITTNTPARRPFKTPRHEHVRSWNKMSDLKLTDRNTRLTAGPCWSVLDQHHVKTSSICYSCQTQHTGPSL